MGNHHGQDAYAFYLIDQIRNELQLRAALEYIAQFIELTTQLVAVRKEAIIIVGDTGLQVFDKKDDPIVYINKGFPEHGAGGLMVDKGNDVLAHGQISDFKSPAVPNGWEYSWRGW
jgi:hypothetical protein